MTAKRFTRDEHTGYLYDNGEIVEDVMKLLNALHEENEQLKSVNMEYEDALGRLEKENEQLKKDRFICLDCEHSGYTEIGCLCEYTDNWQEHITECEDFKELEE